MAAKFKIIAIASFLVLLGVFARYQYRGTQCKADLAMLSDLNKRVLALGEIVAIEALNSQAFVDDDTRVSRFQNLKFELLKLQAMPDYSQLDAKAVNAGYSSLSAFHGQGGELLRVPNFSKKRPEKQHLRSVNFDDLKKHWTYEVEQFEHAKNEAHRPLLCR